MTYVTVRPGGFAISGCGLAPSQDGAAPNISGLCRGAGAARAAEQDEPTAGPRPQDHTPGPRPAARRVGGPAAWGLIRSPAP
jgi:hypothetical protein